MCLDEALASRNHSGKTAFHICRTPAMQHPVNDVTRKGGVGPLLLGASRYDVRMSCEHKKWPLCSTTEPQIPHFSIVHGLWRESMRQQLLCDQVLTGLIIWRHRGPSYQGLGNF